MKEWKVVAVWTRSGEPDEDEVIAEFDAYLEAKKALLSITQHLGERDRTGFLLKTIRIDGDYLKEYLRGR